MEVVVVGGGPVGMKAASILAKDRDVLVLEEHLCSGKPVQCAGIISPEVYKMAGVKASIINRIRGARIIFPNGKEIYLKVDEDKAYVIDRDELDGLMAEKAIDSGVEVRYGEKYLSHFMNGNYVSVSATSGITKTKMIIGANGCSESLIPDNQPKECLRGMGAEIKYESKEQDVVTICIGSNIAPGFFTWEIPMGNVTRVGMASVWSAGPPMDYFKNFLKKRNLDNCKIISKYCGKIPIGARRRTYSDNLILVGDAASQIKPISGGGLYPGFKCSDTAAKIVNEAFEADDFSSKFLSKYEKEWKKEMGKEFSRAEMMRSKYVKLNDDEFNYIQKSIDSENFIDDMKRLTLDNPSEAMFSLFKHPSVLIKAIPLVAKVTFR